MYAKGNLTKIPEKKNSMNFVFLKKQNMWVNKLISA